MTTVIVALAGTAYADDQHEHPLPDRFDNLTARAASWSASGSWKQTATVYPDGGGTRVAALLQVPDAGPAIALQARGVDGARTGAWLPLEETFRGDEHRVAVVDLDGHWRGAQLRIADADNARVGDLGWELLTPAFPDAGRISRQAALETPTRIFALDPTLARVGVITREAWGARPTTCSATEDDWYRMAIHHTAGAQISGGTVQGAVQATQAYTMDSGTYCDLPYQFMVGYDGTLYEGRSLALASGATGGGNNPGNIAVCFVGCYHPNSCSTSHQETEEMMSAARLLVQTLVRVHDIPSNADAIKGHRDWPGNATACPGDFVHARLDELRADQSWYSAEETGRSFAGADDEPTVIPVGEAVELWVELRNTGGLSWEPGVTNLGNTGPRDSDSPLYDGTWPTTQRLATVAEPTAPGEVGRFVFNVNVDAAGDYEQTVGLVHEGVTWFGDAPWGGGPGDEALVIRVLADDDADDPDKPDDPDDPDDTDDDDVVSGGCALAAESTGRPAPAFVLLALASLLTKRRRRR